MVHRPPPNLLRQEISGTSIYLEILHKSTTVSESGNEENLKSLAEEKLVSFCGQILREASDLQPVTGEAASADIHRVLDLRAPVIVKVKLFFRTHMNLLHLTVLQLYLIEYLQRSILIMSKWTH